MKQLVTTIDSVDLLLYRHIGSGDAKNSWESFFEIPRYESQGALLNTLRDWRSLRTLHTGDDARVGARWTRELCVR
jgi:hypothetical protein